MTLWQIWAKVALAPLLQEDELADECYTGIYVCYPNGKPYQSPVFLSTTINNCEFPDITNFESQLIRSMLSPGNTVEFQFYDNRLSG